MAKLTPTILEGDIESNIEIAVLNLCSINLAEYHKDVRVFTRKIFEKNLEEILNFIKNHHYKRIALLILGYFILLTGSKVDHDIKKSIIKVCNWTYEKDDWSWEFKLGRRFYLNDLRDKLSLQKSGVITHLVSLKNINNEDMLNGIIGIDQFKESIKSRKIFRVKHINLDCCGLFKIPSIVFKLTSLNTLSLDYNRIKKIPCLINKLKFLKALYLEGNLIKTIPQCFQNMHHLEVLVLSNNEISGLSKITLAMKSLKDLVF